MPPRLPLRPLLSNPRTLSRLLDLGGNSSGTSTSIATRSNASVNLRCKSDQSQASTRQRPISPLPKLDAWSDGKAPNAKPGDVLVPPLVQLDGSTGAGRQRSRQRNVRSNVKEQGKVHAERQRRSEVLLRARRAQGLAAKEKEQRGGELLDPGWADLAGITDPEPVHGSLEVQPAPQSTLGHKLARKSVDSHRDSEVASRWARGLEDPDWSASDAGLAAEAPAGEDYSHVQVFVDATSFARRDWEAFRAEYPGTDDAPAGLFADPIHTEPPALKRPKPTDSQLALRQPNVGTKNKEPDYNLWQLLATLSNNGIGSRVRQKRWVEKGVDVPCKVDLNQRWAANEMVKQYGDETPVIPEDKYRGHLCYWLICKVKLKPSGKGGRVWGKFVWRGRIVTPPGTIDPIPGPSTRNYAWAVARKSRSKQLYSYQELYEKHAASFEDKADLAREDAKWNDAETLEAQPWTDVEDHTHVHPANPIES